MSDRQTHTLKELEARLKEIHEVVGDLHNAIVLVGSAHPSTAFGEEKADSEAHPDPPAVVQRLDKSIEALYSSLCEERDRVIAIRSWIHPEE